MAEQNRQWVELPAQLYSTDATCNCDFCGKRVSRRYLRISEQGRNFRFCNEDCLTLWYDYWLPRYGATIGLNGATS